MNSNGRTYTFPLPWSDYFSAHFQDHWTQRARADRIARHQARDTLRKIAPTLKVPPGHVCEIEVVFIRPNKRAVSAVRLAERVSALRHGFADALGCEVWHFRHSHRVAKVPTPNGEILVRLAMLPVKGWNGADP
jgi:hypothetical protein